MSRVIYVQMEKCEPSIRQRGFVRFYGIKVPRHLASWQDSSSVAFVSAPFIMVCVEPILHCWNHNGSRLFYIECEEVDVIQTTCSIFIMSTVIRCYGLLVDLVVFPMLVSAFVTSVRRCFRNPSGSSWGLPGAPCRGGLRQRAGL